MKLNIDYNVDHDVWNYLRVYNQKGSSYGRTDFRHSSIQHRPEQYHALFDADLDLETLQGKLTQALQEEMEASQGYESKIHQLEDMWQRVGGQVEHYLARLYHRPFPFTEDILTIHFTTLRSCPYKYEDRMIFCDLNCGSRDQIRIIIHELNHFMYYYYFGNLKDELGNEKSELLKESLSFFSNPEQGAYPAAEPLVKLYMSRQWDSIDEAIEAGADLLKITPR